MNSAENNSKTVISSGTILRFFLIGILLFLLFYIRDLILVLVASVVIASAVEPGTLWLVKRKIPRAVSVLLIYVAVIAILVVLFYMFVPILIEDIRILIGNLPDYVDAISNKTALFKGIPELNLFLKDLSQNISGDTLISNFGGPVTGATYGFFALASNIFGGLLSLILIIVLSFYLAVQEDGVTNFLRMVLPIQYEKYVIGLWKRTKNKIGLWMQGQLLLCVLIGILTYLGLSILGVKNALFLALLAAVFELIPIFGPILSSIPAIFFAIFQGGISMGLIVAGLYIIVQQFENHLIYPLVVRKIVGIPSIIAIVALIIGAKLAGFLGIVLSIPIAAGIMEYLNDVEKRKIELGSRSD